MPIEAYNKSFGGKPGSAMKAYNAMLRAYGKKKGKRVFYAKVNKMKSHLTGMLSSGKIK